MEPDGTMNYVVFFGILLPLLFAGIQGPLMYYQETILNIDALTEKYRKEGVRLQGEVVQRWKTGEGDSDGVLEFHVRVVYRVDQNRYVKNDMVVNEDLYSEQKLDLIRLLEYPKSAVIFESAEAVDPDFPASNLCSVLTPFLWMTICNIIPISIILSSFEACGFCTNLIGPVFFGMIALELLVGYWVAKRVRDNHLKSTLYDAKQVSSGAADDITPKYVSYSDFVDEGTHSCFFVISRVLWDFITAVAQICFAVYLLLFGGGYMIMDSLVVARWRYNILHHYESESKQVVGSIVCRQGHATMGDVIVQYTVDSQVYKKRLAVPSHETVPDDSDLLYIMDNPASATLKCKIDNPHHERKKDRINLIMGFCLLIIQVGICTPIFPSHLFMRVYTLISPSHLFMLVAGILLACHIIFGFMGACIKYKFFFKRELLWGAKRGVPRATENNEILLDEEQELDIGVSLEQGWDELTQTTADESVNTTERFVDNFMKGKLFV